MESSGRVQDRVQEEDQVIDIDHVQLAAPQGCEAAAREFFCDILGLREVAKPLELSSRGGCWFQCGSHQIHIGVEIQFRPAQKAHPAFAVRDLGLLREKLLGARINIEEDASTPNVLRFYIHDPWGNRLEFVQR